MIMKFRLMLSKPMQWLCG